MNKIIIIHNQDFNCDNIHSSDEPPSAADPDYKARANITKVVAHVHDTLIKLGHPQVAIMPIKSLDDLRPLKIANNVSLIFNLCESLEADAHMEPQVVNILEQFGLAFTGNSSLPLLTCLNKYSCNQRLAAKGLNIPESFLIENTKDLRTLLKTINFNKYFIVKPNSHDGSIAIDAGAVIHNAEELTSQCQKLKSLGIHDIIVQEFIGGKEFNLALLNPRKKTFSVSEISFSSLPSNIPRILGYSAKWDEDTIEYQSTKSVPAIINKKMKQLLLSTALKACTILGIDSYARFDFRLDEQDRPYLIDINPNCDLDPTAGFTNSFAFCGIKYEQIIEQIVAQATIPKFQHAPSTKQNKTAPWSTKLLTS